MALFAFLLLIALYTLFQARFLILGPEITIASPEDGATVSGPAFDVIGTAKNVSYLTLDGRRIYTDESGHWQERLVGAEGYNIVNVVAKDRLGRTREKSLSIVIN